MGEAILFAPIAVVVFGWFAYISATNAVKFYRDTNEPAFARYFLSGLAGLFAIMWGSAPIVIFAVEPIGSIIGCVIGLVILAKIR